MQSCLLRVGPGIVGSQGVRLVISGVQQRLDVHVDQRAGDHAEQ